MNIQDHPKYNPAKKGKYPTLNNKPISDEHWNNYIEKYNQWFIQHLKEETLGSFQAAMSEPNPPNYFKANND